MPSTRELETEELPSATITAEVQEDLTATATEEVSALLETSESLVSKVSPVEEPHSHSGSVEAENEVKEDTDVVADGYVVPSVPQVCCFMRPSSFVDLRRILQLTVDGSSIESVVEQPRPWTPSYSVTSQGSPLHSTAELSAADTLDNEAVTAPPHHPVTELEVEDATAVDFSITDEAAVPVATSERFISEATAAEESQGVVEVESAVEQTEVSDEPVGAPTTMVTDTDAAEEHVPQVCLPIYMFLSLTHCSQS